MNLKDAERIARVRGHLEGYADALTLAGEIIDRGALVGSLREDAAELLRVLEKKKDD